MILNQRVAIATEIYCAHLRKEFSPDVVLCLEKADEILREAKETQGFFVDVEKYNKAITALKAQLDKETSVSVSIPNGKTKKQIVIETLKELGEL